MEEDEPNADDGAGVEDMALSSLDDEGPAPPPDPDVGVRCHTLWVDPNPMDVLLELWDDSPNPVDALVLEEPPNAVDALLLEEPPNAAPNPVDTLLDELPNPPPNPVDFASDDELPNPPGVIVVDVAGANPAICVDGAVVLLALVTTVEDVPKTIGAEEEDEDEALFAVPPPPKPPKPLDCCCCG